MYITLEEYSQLYDAMDEQIFNRLCFDACRVMDIHTTGIDNVKKLKRFFPEDEADAQAVKYCAAKLISLMDQIQQSEMMVYQMRGAVQTEQGLRGKVISSVSAGNESISYATGSNCFTTAIDSAVKDKTARDKLMADTVWEYLRGVQDANGVNLLYMGRYPGGYLC